MKVERVVEIKVLGQTFSVKIDADEDHIQTGARYVNEKMDEVLRKTRSVSTLSLFWTVLSVGAQLFHLIGVEWPKETISEAWFAIPVTTLSIALGLRTGLRRAAFTVTLRNHWLTLTVWLLPLASLIGVAFVLTSFAGVGKLFERGLSAVFLLWFVAFWITFFNSAFQDGEAEPPLHRVLRRVLPFTALALLAVVGLAAWALILRIHQHGLTPDRIWGPMVVAIARVYGMGYVLTLRGRWPRWPARSARPRVRRPRERAHPPRS